MTPILEYLKEEILPADVKKARAVKCKSQRFAVISKTLYRKSFLEPWQRCVGPLQANYVLREIHEGSCNIACQDCQIHKPVSRNPQQKLTPITSSWPFYKWGIDIAGPFLEGLGKVKFLIVAMDYFTKWIEAKPVATITGNQVKKFVWDNIVCRFGLPSPDNEKQFQDNPFKDWCEKLCIHQHFASVKHPQTNGLVERANRSLGEGIKASFKLGDMVYRNNDASRAKDTGKLVPKWEGPYKDMEALGKGAYELRDRDEKQLPQTWNTVCKPHLDKFVIVFIDDIFVYSKDEEEHGKHLKIILELLKKERLYAKFSKCDFRLDSVQFLGHMIDRSGVHVDPAKIKAIKN
ncbi:reverse transcriptase domain-containing protein [Tanacetum coccineum]|uniref:Reverse transcriptase domain-containing protein n=1 Tax=Tanacetum coccineum TaxID=301880 RepID=A0ABQ4XP91_9ASTR